MPISESNIPSVVTVPEAIATKVDEMKGALVHGTWKHFDDAVFSAEEKCNDERDLVRSTLQKVLGVPVQSKTWKDGGKFRYSLRLRTRR